MSRPHQEATGPHHSPTSQHISRARADRPRAAGRTKKEGGLGGRSIHDRARIRIKTALTSLESIPRSRVPRRGALERHAPRGVAILPREVAVAAPNWQNGLPAPLARDRGAPGTQRGHPDSRVTLSSRLDQVSLRCWLDTSPPRRRDAPHAHDAGAERARGVRVGLSTSYSAPSCLSPLGLFTRGQCSAASGRAAHYHALEQPAGTGASWTQPQLLGCRATQQAVSLL